MKPSEGSRPRLDSFQEQRERIVAMRGKLASSASDFLDDIKEFRLGGRELRAPQVDAAVAFEAWLAGISRWDAPAMGRVVAPPGMGKTATAVLLTQMVGGKSVYFTHTKHQGDDACDEFERHNQTLPERQRSSLGRCFGSRTEPKADVVVGHFSGWEKWGHQVDWSQVGAIFADEADVNALSKQRADILRSLASEYGIPIIGLSATEFQASGKKLSDVFPDEILYMPIPRTLPRLREMDLIPHLQFKDIVLDCSLAIDAEQGGEIEELTVQDFIRSTAWNAKILEEYQKICLAKGRTPKGVVVFRNNLLVEDFVEQAQKNGLRAAAFVGDETEAELNAIKKRMDSGEIDLLAGSRLLQRGFNQLDLEVVINSTLTRSPQIFWQTNGRGMRFDPFHPDRSVDVLVMVPRMVVDKRTGRELPSYQRPLCNSAFFDREYYPGAGSMASRRRSDPRSVLHTAPQKLLSLQLSDVDFIRSIDEVIKLIGDYHRKPPEFVGRPRQVGEAICSLQELTLKNLMRLLRVPAKQRRTMEMANEGEEKMSEILPYDWEDELTKTEETKLLQIYMAGRNAQPESEEYQQAEKALLRILETHEPIVQAFAHAFASDSGKVEDLLQEGRITMIESLKVYDPDKKRARGRLVSYFVKGLFWHMSRAAAEVSGAFRIPSSAAYQVEKLLPLWERFCEAGSMPTGEEFVAMLEEVEIIPTKKNVPVLRRLLESKEPNVDIDDLADDIAAPEEDEQLVQATQSEIREAFIKILKTVSYRERETIKLRYGIGDDGQTYTLDEVGGIFKVSRERIRQIEIGAIRKLQLPNRKDKLRQFLGEENAEESVDESMGDYY